MVSKQVLVYALAGLVLLAAFLLLNPQKLDVANPFERGKPVVAGVTVPTNFSINQQFSGTVTVRNTGGTDRFEIAITSTNSAVTASPASYTRTIAGKDEDTTSVIFTGGKAGADQLCIQVTAQGSGETANLCRLVEVR